MAKNKKPNELLGREEFQSKEPYPVQKNDLPKDRFQDEVQTSTANQTVTKGDDFMPKDTGSVKPDASSVVARAATTVKKKMSIKPTSDTGLDDSKLVGGVPLGDSGVGASVAGPISASIPGDTSRVPYTRGGFRAGERYGKKISTDNFIINNVVSEQIEPSFEEPKDLREAPNAVQGYNGRKQFKTARGKKIYGQHVASTLFERSVDFEEHSAVVHTTGQVLNNIDARAGYPVPNVDSGNTGPYFVEQAKGNYLINALRLTITNGMLTNIEFDEDQIISPIDTDSVNYANLNWQVDVNNVAKAMVKMQTELGRETTDKWSPLGYVIEQPYQFGMLFHDGEAILGSLTGAAYKSAAHSLAFLQNKMSKEGVRGLSSINEWLSENFQHATDYTAYNANVNEAIFNHGSYNRGSAAAIIEMFDSTAKYSTKADFINQPRSFKMHLQTVDNNINPFHAKSEFYAALDKAMMFSTVDGQYNPTLPIHVTNTIKVMTPYSLNKWLHGWKNPRSGAAPTASTFNSFYNETGIVSGCRYSYQDIRNNYDWMYTDPFVAGLCRWLLRHEQALIKTYGNNAVVNIPVNFGLTSASMFAFMVCSASQDMAWMRNVIFRDYLFAGDQGVYVWDDLESLSNINPVYASQYKYSNYGEALGLGSLADASKIRLMWPEVIMPKEAHRYKNDAGNDTRTSNVAYVLPFYFNEEGIDTQNSSGVSDVRGAIMSYPIIRNGVNHDFIDVLYSMEERDVRLCLDKMVTLPVTTSYQDGVVTGQLNADKYDKYSLRYDDNSDGRVILALKFDLYNDKDKQAYALHDWTYLATARELGFLFPLPANIDKPIEVSPSLAATAQDFTNIVRNAYITGATSDFITCYRASEGNTNNVIDRSASLTQVWHRCFANPAAREINNNFVTTTSIVPTLAAMFDAQYTQGDNHDEITSFSLVNADLYSIPAIYGLRTDELVRDTFDSGDSSSLSTNKVFSLAKCLWTIIQRCYSPINKYDSAFFTVRDGGALPVENDGIATDPLELAEYFGFAGCLGSDYNQDIMDRLDKKDQLGMFYYKDEFINSSLIFNK